MTGSGSLRAPEPLSKAHDLSAFDCGNPDLNAWLVKQAGLSEGRSARTYVVAQGTRVVAYYSLAAGSVMRGDLPKAKLRQNLPEQVPVIVLGRLAVDRSLQSRGFGKGLLKEAILRAIEASQLVGIRAIVVHAIDDAVCRFYERLGFVPFRADPRILVLPIETARQGI